MNHESLTSQEVLFLELEEFKTQSFVKLVCSACRSCRFHRVSTKRILPELRIPLPNVPNDTWMIDFMVFKQDQYFRGRKIVAAFNIMDLFSNLLISVPVKDQKAETVINSQLFPWFNKGADVCLNDGIDVVSIPIDFRYVNVEFFRLYPDYIRVAFNILEQGFHAHDKDYTA